MMPSTQETLALRRRWKHAEQAKAFHATHNYAPYAMVFKGGIRARMDDATLPAVTRVLEWLHWFGTGHLSDQAKSSLPAITPEDRHPYALSQVDIAVDLNLSPSTVSSALSQLRCRRHLESDRLALLNGSEGAITASVSASESIELSRSDSDSSNSDAPNSYQKFTWDWLENHEDIAAEVTQIKREAEEARAAAKKRAARMREIDRQHILPAYRAYLRRASNGGVNSTPAAPPPPSGVNSTPAAPPAPPPAPAAVESIYTPPQPTPTPPSHSSYDKFGTPESEFAECEPETALSASVSNESDGDSLMFEDTILRYPPTHSGGLVGEDTIGMAERQAEVLSVTLRPLVDKFHEIPGEALLAATVHALQGAPAERLRAYVVRYLATAKGLGIAASYARKVGDAWALERAERERQAAEKAAQLAQAEAHLEAMRQRLRAAVARVSARIGHAAFEELVAVRIRALLDALPDRTESPAELRERAEEDVVGDFGEQIWT